MKKLYLIFVLVFILVVLAACGSAGKSVSTAEGKNPYSADNPLVLRVAESASLEGPMVKYGSMPFMKLVEEMSEGAIQFEHYTSEQLGKQRELLDLTKSGVADIAWINISNYSDRFPLSSVGELPGVFSDAPTASKVYTKFVDDFLLDEYYKNGVVPVHVQMGPPSEIQVNQDVRSVEDFKGLKIRTNGGVQSKVVTKLGATPITIPGTEAYLALDRKTIDGSMTAITISYTYQYATILDYYTINGALGTSPTVYVMNKNKYDGLPAEFKEIFVEAKKQIDIQYGESLNNAVEEEKKKLTADNKNLIEFEDAELKEIHNTLSSVWNEWAKEMDSAGLAGTETMEAFRKAIDENK